MSEEKMAFEVGQFLGSTLIYVLFGLITFLILRKIFKFIRKRGDFKPNITFKRSLLIISFISTLIIAFSVAYYFVVFLPKNEAKKLELSRQQLESQKQQFEYQVQKDEEVKNKAEIKEIRDKFNAAKEAEQANWNRARAECVEMADKNYASFKSLVEGCRTELCVNEAMSHKELMLFGDDFIDSCTEKRL